MLKREDIRVRDPFIVFEDGVYYLYATTGATTYSYYHSRDLENFEEGGVAFEIPDDFWAYKDVWAGEVHKYRGKFYLFVSLLGKNGLRGTQVAVSDSPRGPFLPLVPRAVTPLDQSCIDGTLYVHDGKPYIFYSHDWPDNYVEEKSAYVGELWGAELTEDLTAIKGETVVLLFLPSFATYKFLNHPFEKVYRPLCKRQARQFPDDVCDAIAICKFNKKIFPFFIPEYTFYY